jgi:transcriptional regulator with GAF, ATPase, and Fis domain
VKVPNAAGDVEVRPDRSWLWIAVAAFFVLLAPIAGEIARRSVGTKVTVFVAVSVVSTGLAFLIPQARQIAASRSEATAEEREIDARVETRVAMNDALDPILRLLGNLALEPDDVLRNQMRAQAIPLVLKTAAEFIGPERSRACWFRLDAGPPTHLVPTDFAGRAGAPTTTFEEGTPAGDAAIGMVLADQDRLCEDVQIDPPPGWDPVKERDYRTFVAVSVIAGDTAYGMLTLDALEPGDLTVEDKGLLRLMAGVLAVALSVR